MQNKIEMKRLEALTEAQMKQAVAEDDDTFIPDASWFARARVVMPQPKDVVTLRLDHEVLAWFRHDGRGYQTRINAVLKAFVEAQQRHP